MKTPKISPKSSIESTPKKGGRNEESERINKDDLTRIKDVIYAIEKRPEVVDFLKPVNYKDLGLEDYPIIIKNPMDLSTIKKKLRLSKYKKTSEVINDIKLIWDNCRTYNQIDSAIVKQANILEEVMKKQCEINQIVIDVPQKRLREEPIPEPVKETLKIEVKLEFVEKIKKVSHKVLAELVKIIEADCSQALEDLDNDRIQIKIDSLDKETFDKLNSVVNTYLEDPVALKKHRNK